MYCGSPLSVLRVIAGSDRLQPNPNGPLPEPESYERINCGPNPDLPGLVAIGTVTDPVPVTGLAANFSPMPRIAPPPFGREMAGAEKTDRSSVLLFCWLVVREDPVSNQYRFQGDDAILKEGWGTMVLILRLLPNKSIM